MNVGVGRKNSRLRSTTTTPHAPSVLQPRLRVRAVRLPQQLLRLAAHVLLEAVARNVLDALRRPGAHVPGLVLVADAALGPRRALGRLAAGALGPRAPVAQAQPAHAHRLGRADHRRLVAAEAGRGRHGDAARRLLPLRPRAVGLVAQRHALHEHGVLVRVPLRHARVPAAAAVARDVEPLLRQRALHGHVVVELLALLPDQPALGLLNLALARVKGEALPVGAHARRVLAQAVALLLGEHDLGLRRGVDVARRRRVRVVVARVGHCGCVCVCACSARAPRKPSARDAQANSII